MTQSNYHSGQRGDECHFCNEQVVEEHHVIPQRFGGPDTRENIVDVCPDCHDKLERLYDKSFYEFFGVEDEQGERMFHRVCVYNDCDTTATRVVSFKESYLNAGSHPPEYACVPMCDECLLERVRERDGRSDMRSTTVSVDYKERMDYYTVEESDEAGYPDEIDESTQPQEA